MKLYDTDIANLCPDAKRYEQWLKFCVESKPTERNVSELYLVYSRKPELRDWKKAVAQIELYNKLLPDNYWARYRFGLFNLFGIERPKNVEEGIRLIKLSTEENNYPYAAEMLSYIYDKGIGVEKNPAESAKWLEKFKAAKFHPYGEIAARYVRGSDGVTDLERSKFILKLGADAGDKSCKRHLENFDAYAKSRMAPSLVKEADAGKAP